MITFEGDDCVDDQNAAMESMEGRRYALRLFIILVLPYFEHRFS